MVQPLLTDAEKHKRLRFLAVCAAVFTLVTMAAFASALPTPAGPQIGEATLQPPIPTVTVIKTVRVVVPAGPLQPKQVKVKSHGSVQGAGGVQASGEVTQTSPIPSARPISELGPTPSPQPRTSRPHTAPGSTSHPTSHPSPSPAPSPTPSPSPSPGEKNLVCVGSLCVAHRDAALLSSLP